MIGNLHYETLIARLISEVHIPVKGCDSNTLKWEAPTRSSNSKNLRLPYSTVAEFLISKGCKTFGLTKVTA